MVFEIVIRLYVILQAYCKEVYSARRRPGASWVTGFGEVGFPPMLLKIESASQKKK